MRKAIVPAVLGILLGGCADTGMQDLHAYVAEVKARPPGPIEPIPQIKEAETFLYVAGGRRDPFAPSEEGEEEQGKASGSGVVPDFNRRKEELEGYSLDSLRMVGTLQQQEAFWGLVKTNDGTIHRVRVGNYLGRNHGQITQIGEDQIDLRELVQDGGGGYIERQASLALGNE